jgi:hypothetical protein
MIDRIEFASRLDIHEAYDAIWWRTGPIYGGGEYARPATFLVNCNDFFYAAADAEEITPENVEELDKAFRDCKAAAGFEGLDYAPLLFCARVRRMGNWRGKPYPEDNAALQALFDEAKTPIPAPPHAPHGDNGTPGDADTGGNGVGDCGDTTGDAG